jgi:phosphotransferase system enzyme I (PtsI)
MTVLRGKSVLQDIGMGKLHYFHRSKTGIKRYMVSDKARELDRFAKAKAEAVLQLKELYDQTLNSVGEENAAIFTIHEMLLEEEEYVSSIRHMIMDQNLNLEYAISQTAENLSRMFHSMEDPYMRERATDIEDISNRLLRILSGKEEDFSRITENCILAAEDLVPSETVNLPKDLVKGFALQKGSIYSHTAILARSMGVPAVVELGGELSEKWDGELAVIDGIEGMVYLSPEESQLGMLRMKQEEVSRQKERLSTLKGKENRTKSGKLIQIYANVDHINQAREAWQQDGGGIGLFRSEIFYMEGKEAPGEEEQYQYYSRLLKEAKDREVIIRTVDIGGDKEVPFLEPVKEANPALGLRGIRLCLARPELLKTQLAALYRAGVHGQDVHGHLKIMYPMVTSMEEMEALRLIEVEVKDALFLRGVDFASHIPTGIMIETPAAALISDRLAKVSDFFSIGTNDLTQYTLAMDRQNASVAPFVNPYHPAVMQLIRMTVENAHAAGINVSICGELAADLAVTEEWIRMGVDGLSVHPAAILPLRAHIRTLEI